MTWNRGEYFAFKNIAATPAPFTLRGGNYGVSARSAAWGGGSATLQRLASDGATYVTVLTAFSPDYSSGLIILRRL
jgi:hypothetical protein